MGKNTAIGMFRLYSHCFLDLVCRVAVFFPQSFSRMREHCVYVRVVQIEINVLAELFRLLLLYRPNEDYIVYTTFIDRGEQERERKREMK